MKPIASLIGGGAATCGLMLLLSLLAPREQAPPLAAERARPKAVLRAPVEEPSVHPVAEALRPRASASPRGAAGPAGAGAPGRIPGARASGWPAAVDPAPRRAPARDRESAIAWSGGTSWGRDALAPIPLPLAGGLEGGDPRATSAGGGGTGRGGGEATPRRPSGPTRGVIAIHTPQPAYPSSARSREESGWVEALITVDPSGSVSSVVVSGGSGHSALEDAVRGTVSRWRFQPAVRDGVPRQATIRRRFEFRMVDR
jgi:protein TonB